jgi:hypothetical protein
LRSLEIMHAALAPWGFVEGTPEGEAEQEKPGPKAKREGIAVGVVNFEEAWEVE